uniref:Uncharacterized protein n=1 Tax=Chaetoceros debilis TaxID=122233 RepID=A0A7S3PUF0_9STRA
MNISLAAHLLTIASLAKADFTSSLRNLKGKRLAPTSPFAVTDYSFCGHVTSSYEVQSSELVVDALSPYDSTVSDDLLLFCGGNDNDGTTELNCEEVALVDCEATEGCRLNGNDSQCLMDPGAVYKAWS